MNTEQIVFGSLMAVLVIVCLAGDAWAFLTNEERGRLLLWMFMTPWFPLWIVESNAFVHLFAKYVGKSLFPLEPDLFKDFPQ